MNIHVLGSRFSLVVGALLLGALLASSASAQPAAEPMIRANASEQVSEHVHVILDRNVGFVPNVGIVIGDRATLIVDTGLGTANGQIVLDEARRLSSNDTFYLTATHFHPEHDLGALAFPDSATMVRWTGQQAEVDAQGIDTIARFSGFSPVVAELLDGVEYRAPDVLFDDTVTIDLGGVRVVATGVGPAHGRLGDVELIRGYRAYLETVRTRVLAGKRAGQSLDAITADLVPVITNEFGGLTPAGGNPSGRISAAIQAAYRLD